MRRDPAERVERRRVIAAGIERLRAADPQRYDEILLRLRRYEQRLRDSGCAIDISTGTSRPARR